MIVITGPGRSGTSVLARLYKELGFDPGGRWHPEINAGLEDSSVIAANTDVAAALGMSLMRPRMSVPAAAAPARRVIPRGLRKKAYRLIARRRAPQLMDWSRFPETVERYGDRLVELAAERRVVKDPRFSWTLPVWAAAGAPIDHVIICTRDLSAVSASREATGNESFNTSAIRNSIVYGVGMAFVTVQDYALPHTVLRFPDFLEDPADLHRRLTFPEPVEQDDVASALARVRRADLVHHNGRSSAAQPGGQLPQAAAGHR
jgi:hypothetical protein